jgi:hypothetical protein
MFVFNGPAMLDFGGARPLQQKNDTVETALNITPEIDADSGYSR